MSDIAEPKLIRVWSESPIDDLWSYYRRYEVIDLVLGKAGGDQTRAEEAGHCVRQAREYFRSARGAPLLTRPLLLYYGMVSLGKVILLLDESEPMSMEEIEAHERQGHGLKQNDPEPFEQKDAFQLEQSTIEVTAGQGKGHIVVPRGIFPQLAARVTPTRGKTWIGKTFKLGEILRAIPQLDLYMRQAFGEDKGFSGLMIDMAWTADRCICHLETKTQPSNPTNPDEVRQRVPYLGLDAGSISPSVDAYHLNRIPVEGTKAHSVVAREELSASTYVLPAALNGERFEGLLAQYMAMYALSIVARYKPHRWAELLEGRRSPLLPVLERLMATAERWWPNIVLNRLEGAIVLFASASYWS